MSSFPSLGAYFFFHLYLSTSLDGMQNSLTLILTIIGSNNPHPQGNLPGRRGFSVSASLPFIYPSGLFYVEGRVKKHVGVYKFIRLTHQLCQLGEDHATITP